MSLFSGCGGFDLAAEAAGIEVVGQCEIEPACIRVLERWWPDVWRWEDIQTVTADIIKEKIGPVDLIFGGPPCQPVSVAGRRRAAGDKRNMWPEFIRVMRDVRPRWAVAENPPGIISAQKLRGDENEWPKGEFFGEIVRETASLGYSVGWGVWGACDVGAPHKRERLFIVAYREEQFFNGAVSSWGGRPGSPDGGFMVDAGGAGREECDATAVAGGARYPSGECACGEVGYPDSVGPQQQPVRVRAQPEDGRLREGERAQPGVGGAADGAAAGVDIYNWDWPAGRGVGQHHWEPPRVVPSGQVRERTSRIKMLGNAVVPQQAVVLFRAIREADAAYAEYMR